MRKLSGKGFGVFPPAPKECVPPIPSFFREVDLPHYEKLNKDWYKINGQLHHKCASRNGAWERWYFVTDKICPNCGGIFHGIGT